jgi:methylated-DNA-protein-cysteine methyltransferase-like protein
MSDKRSQQDFFEMVFQVVRLIPPGRATSYGAIAKYLGAGSSARTVGWAMNASHSQKDYVPAHRVLNRNGQLTGKFHFSEPNAMQNALEAEGIRVENDQVLNWQQHFWDPMRELML